MLFRLPTLVTLRRGLCVRSGRYNRHNLDPAIEEVDLLAPPRNREMLGLANAIVGLVETAAILRDGDRSR